LPKNNSGIPQWAYVYCEYCGKETRIQRITPDFAKKLILECSDCVVQNLINFNRYGCNNIGNNDGEEANKKINNDIDNNNKNDNNDDNEKNNNNDNNQESNIEGK